jgi:hypothetical protein
VRPNDPPTPRKPSANKKSEYYTDVEVAHKLGKGYSEILRMANLGQLPATFVDDQRVFHKQVIDDMAVAKSNPPKGRSAENLPRRKAAEAAKSTLAPLGSKAGGYSLAQAAGILDTDVYEINKMIRQGKPSVNPLLA